MLAMHLIRPLIAIRTTIVTLHFFNSSTTRVRISIAKIVLLLRCGAFVPSRIRPVGDLVRMMPQSRISLVGAKAHNQEPDYREDDNSERNP